MPDETSDVPQQLAARESHPWFHPYWSMNARVLLNGVERKYVTVADGPGRYVEILHHPFRLNAEGELATYRLDGDVVILPRDDTRVLRVDDARQDKEQP